VVVLFFEKGRGGSLAHDFHRPVSERDEHRALCVAGFGVEFEFDADVFLWVEKTLSCPWRADHEHGARAPVDDRASD
jgi:hypothetical protein